MTFGIEEKLFIKNSFKGIIQSGNYEKVILNLMNKSEIIFPNQYIHVESQSKGECDYIDTSTNEKYDAKLPFSNKQGKLIGSRESDYEEWYNLISNIRGEFDSNNEKIDIKR